MRNRRTPGVFSASMLNEKLAPPTPDDRLSQRRVLAQKAIIACLREVGADTSRAERLLALLETPSPQGRR